MFILWTIPALRFYPSVLFPACQSVHLSWWPCFKFKFKLNFKEMQKLITPKLSKVPVHAIISLRGLHLTGLSRNLCPARSNLSRNNNDTFSLPNCLTQMVCLWPYSPSQFSECSEKRWLCGSQDYLIFTICSLASLKKIGVLAASDNFCLPSKKVRHTILSYRGSEMPKNSVVWPLTCFSSVYINSVTRLAWLLDLCYI